MHVVRTKVPYHMALGCATIPNLIHEKKKNLWQKNNAVGLSELVDNTNKFLFTCYKYGLSDFMYRLTSLSSIAANNKTPLSNIIFPVECYFYSFWINQYSSHIILLMKSYSMNTFLSCDILISLKKTHHLTLDKLRGPGVVPMIEKWYSWNS